MFRTTVTFNEPINKFNYFLYESKENFHLRYFRGTDTNLDHYLTDIKIQKYYGSVEESNHDGY